ncbi:hypothetical protein ACS0TY_002804 [Phlomoides rotata]
MRFWMFNECAYHYHLSISLDSATSPMSLGVAAIPPNTLSLALSYTHASTLLSLPPINNPRTPGRRNLVLLSHSNNLDYFNSHQQVIVPGIMETNVLVPEINRTLYSDIEPFNTGFLKVSDIHTIYYEQSGNPDGHPVVFLHGGPGGGTSPSNRKFFDPNFYRIILFDQRGAGKSTPHACLEENTTWDLIEDIEILRAHLKVPEWQVFGGSWGSTLALAYSVSHPDKVTGMVLRGIFMLRKKEIDWFYEGGAAAIFPDAWEPFRDHIPESERGCFVDAYNKRLNSNDKETQYAAARAWTKWEMMTAHLLPNEGTIKRGDNDEFCLAFARIENHYFVNKGFFPSDSFLLDNVEKIKHINTVIVQVCLLSCCFVHVTIDIHLLRATNAQFMNSVNMILESGET